MTLVDRVNRQRSLTVVSRTRRFGRIVANTGVPTTTYSYDANGNLIQAGGWNYVWDYLNRMLATGYNNSTTTYAYDQNGSRMLQTSTTSTTYYPNKYYSLTTTKSGARMPLQPTIYLTATHYLRRSTRSSTTAPRQAPPSRATSILTTSDHERGDRPNGNLVQLMDYYPYGATRIATTTYPTNEKRQYIGQFSDAQTEVAPQIRTAR